MTNYVEEELMHENVKEKIENENAGGLEAILSTMRQTPRVGTSSCSRKARSSMGTSRVSRGPRGTRPRRIDGRPRNV